MNGLYPFGENAFAVHFGIQVLKLHPRATSGIVVLPPNGRMHVLQGSSVYHFRRFSTVFSMFLQRSVQLPIEKANATVSRPTSDCNGKCNRYGENLYKRVSRSHNQR